MDVITPTNKLMHRRVAHSIVKRHSRQLFHPLVDQHTGASITVGSFLMTLVLLGLWQRETFRRIRADGSR